MPDSRTFSTVEDYAKWHRAAEFRATNAQNILLDYTIAPDPKYGEFCIKYFKHEEIHRKAIFTQQVYQRKEWGYWFCLPSRTPKQVCVFYCEQGPPEVLPKELPKEGKAFLEGIKIKTISSETTNR